MPAKVPAVIKNTRAMLVPVYNRKMCARDRPMMAEKPQNTACAVDAFMRLMPKDRASTKAKGENMAT